MCLMCNFTENKFVWIGNFNFNFNLNLNLDLIFICFSRLSNSRRHSIAEMRDCNQIKMIQSKA